jgi:NEDD8-activating enzyme E1 regulatory subunit
MPPTAKEIKYDRQLRLWSSNGQEALEKARLCLINATATGTEILKNLVLPGPPPSQLNLTIGIGGFTILDDKITDGEDVGVNFFLEPTSMGSPRGEQAYKYISELNPDVRGNFNIQVPKQESVLY